MFRAKQAKKQARSMVDYAKGAKRFSVVDPDGREVGMGHSK